ncbi:cholesterol 25-hydroxylase-like [Gigantopelta aegis]|uniref:cholesterol 25-hydroxylase-like n=1 Tax=Gigantopelta aegis TaxID=1735272 RepID=UPI001B88BFDE|nr:cholesterol 25-hydroxylase-like [Gigantopelta aegis]XP_041358748.1 cholesterol 25-hydroxylase-like [Gigantopelta aegis]XP_041358749.1 cholesterol 25-hydroxylase-like [Gigantopelta aegis]
MQTTQNTLRNPSLVNVIRLFLLVLVVLSVYYYDVIQLGVNCVWNYLLTLWFFNSVYFETWLTMGCYLLLNLYPYSVDCLRTLDKYKIEKSVQYRTQTVIGMIQEAIAYAVPFMFLDTFMVKKYCGVEASIWDRKRESTIQYTRALPVDAPTFAQLMFQLMASLILYDVFFFFIHYTLHRSPWLYKTVHKWHHSHDVLECHVTNQLSHVERITLVLSANTALKVFNSHPLTRTVFVPVFQLLLIENHIGYDFPWSLSHVVPFRLMGGARKHYAHHMQGGKHYQPLFSYLDHFLERIQSTNVKFSSPNRKFHRLSKAHSS